MFKATLLFIAFVLFSGLAPQSAVGQNRREFVAPKIGIWQMTGQDEENTRWTGQVRFTKKNTFKSIVRFRGYFIWNTADGQIYGREYFTGIFDKRSGRLKLNGYRVTNVRGALAPGFYVAFVNNKGRRISRGIWGGDGVVNGKWSARWLKFK